MPSGPRTNCGRVKLWLVGCLGSEPRLTQLQTRRCATFIKRLGETATSGERNAGRATTLHRRPWHLFTTEGKSRKTLSQAIRKTLGWPAPNAIRLVDLAIAGDGLDWPAGIYRPWLSRKATWSTLGQRKYLPSCRTRGFPTSTNLEWKLAVRALMWSANNGTPRSSCICLLPIRGTSSKVDTWIVAPVASGHGCGRRTSTRGTHNPSWAGWAAYIAGLRSWRRDHLLFRRGPSIPIPWAVLFLTWSIWGDQVSRVSRVTPYNGLYRLIRSSPRIVLLVGAGRNAVRHAGRLSRCY